MTQSAYHVVVGRIVRLHRECKGIGLRDFAKKMGLGISGWSRVETGDTTMTVTQLHRACSVLRIKPGDLIQQADSFVNLPPAKPSTQPK